MTDMISAASALVRLSFLVQAIYLEVAEAHGLTVASAQLLCVIKDRPRGMTELAHMLRVEKSSLTGLVDRTEKRGFLVRRAGGDDKRSLTVELTETGRPVTEAFYSEVTRRLDAVVQLLPKRDETRFTELAGRIVLSEDIPPLLGLG